MLELYTFSKIVQWGNYIYVVVAETPKEALEFIDAEATVSITREDLKYRVNVSTHEEKGIKFSHEYDAPDCEG